MEMISSNSNSTAAASAPRNHEEEQEAMVSSPTKKEQGKGRNGKQASGSGERDKLPRPPQEPALKCPRCDSTSTKFCYYNNYSLTQPRYYCKTCRRYWTQGGSLRHVPVGGGSRRNKRATGSGSGSGTAGASANASSLSSTHDSSSLSSSSTRSSSNMVNSIVSKQLMMMPSMTTMHAPTMTGLFADVLSTFMSTTESGEFDLAVNDQQQVSLPTATPPSLSLSSNHEAALAPGASGTASAPSFLDMLREGFLDGGGGSNGMDIDMLFPLPSFDAMDGIVGTKSSITEAAMQTQLVGTQQGVNGGEADDGLQWTSSSQHGNYTNDGGGYAYAGSTGAQQAVDSDEKQQEEDTK